MRLWRRQTAPCLDNVAPSTSLLARSFLLMATTPNPPPNALARPRGARCAIAVSSPACVACKSAPAPPPSRTARKSAPSFPRSIRQPSEAFCIATPRDDAKTRLNKLLLDAGKKNNSGRVPAPGPRSTSSFAHPRLNARGVGYPPNPMIPALLLVIAAVAYRVAAGLLIHSGTTWLSNFAPFAAHAFAAPFYFPRAKIFSAAHLRFLFRTPSSIPITGRHIHAIGGLPPVSPPSSPLVASACSCQNRASFARSCFRISRWIDNLYVTTNAFAWISDPGYVHSSGLIQALTVPVLPQYSATPSWMFFRNSLLSDLLFTGLFVLCIGGRPPMPLPIWLAHRLAHRLSEVRKAGDPPVPPARREDASHVRLRGRPLRLKTVLISTQHAPGLDAETLIKPDLIEHVHPSARAGAVRAGSLRRVGEPDRLVRARRSPCRLRAHRPQDHRRHVRRHGPSRRRCVLGQGSVEGRPLGRVRRSMGGQERRRLAAASRCEIQVAYAIGVARPVSVMVETFGTGDRRRRQAHGGRAGGVRPAARGDHPRPRPAAADLPQDGGVRALRPPGEGVHLGGHDPRR